MAFMGSRGREKSYPASLREAMPASTVNPFFFPTLSRNLEIAMHTFS